MENARRDFRRSFALVCAAGLAAFLALGCGPRSASEVPPAALVRLLEAMGVSDFDAARDELARLDRDALTGPQEALVLRIESQLHGLANEYAPALESLDRAIASGDLDPDEQLAARFDKGWLHAQLGQTAQAVEAYESWQKALSTPPTNSQLLTMSEAYAAARDCPGAAALIDKAYARVTPEETIDVAAALQVALPLCSDDPAFARYLAWNPGAP